MSMEQERIVNIENVGPSSSKKKRFGRIITLAVIAAIGAGVFLFFKFQESAETVSIKSYETAKVYAGELISTTEASGTVVLPAQVTIVSPEDGYTDELLTEEGAIITTEDILATLEVPDLEDELDTLTVSLKQAEIELESIITGYEYQIKTLNLSIERLAEDIKDAEEDVAAYKELAELKSSRETDYEDAVDVLEELLEEKEDYEISLEEAKVMMNIDIRKQEASISQIETNLEITKEDIEDSRIKSPIAGEVLSINEDLAIEGSVIEEADELFIVADRAQSYIDFDVYEQYADLLEIGGEMTVTIGSDTMKAEIVKIGKIASMDSDGLSAMITVRAKPITEETLTPGASAVASITLGVEENVLMIPRGAYLTTGSQKWVYKVEDGKAYKTQVTYGSIEGTTVEILSGLKAGDKIITSSYQSFIDEELVVLK
ncbi:MAG: efflux RND transporter periplasmic adaptor subunit [Spirochaetales bacterium]|uniref:Efflux RND transporter periplasmic adaptor subunit n=1 Tax=Candidatus Thalassospirochaeta sargassi TaxID=3119039 RepID=A0AAJ1ICC2_9SPIO|nr:efflux RND transporter periplasmic adaptor subunit [Spirochaetales bacterium]